MRKKVEEQLGTSQIWMIERYVAESLDWKLIYPIPECFTTLIINLLCTNTPPNINLLTRHGILFLNKTCVCSPSICAAVALLSISKLASPTPMLSESALRSLLLDLYSKKQLVIFYSLNCDELWIGHY